MWLSFSAKHLIIWESFNFILIYLWKQMIAVSIWLLLQLHRSFKYTVIMHICCKSLGKHVDLGAVWATGREWVVCHSSWIHVKSKIIVTKKVDHLVYGQRIYW